MPVGWAQSVEYARKGTHLFWGSTGLAACLRGVSRALPPALGLNGCLGAVPAGDEALRESPPPLT